MPTLSITVDAAQAARIAEAYGEMLHTPTIQNPVAPAVPVPATMAEIRQHLVNQMTNIVLDYERRKAQRTLVEPPPFVAT